MMLASPVTLATLLVVTQPLLRPSSSSSRRALAQGSALRSSKVPACRRRRQPAAACESGCDRCERQRASAAGCAAARDKPWPSSARWRCAGSRAAAAGAARRAQQQRAQAGPRAAHVIPCRGAYGAALALLLLQPPRLLLAQGLRGPAVGRRVSGVPGCSASCCRRQQERCSRLGQALRLRASWWPLVARWCTSSIACLSPTLAVGSGAGALRVFFAQAE
jgi:hypothetical protein